MIAHLRYSDMGATKRQRACEVPLRVLHLKVTVEDPEPKADARRLVSIVGCAKCRLTLLTLREIDALAQQAVAKLRGVTQC